MNSPPLITSKGLSQYDVHEVFTSMNLNYQQLFKMICSASTGNTNFAGQVGDALAPWRLDLRSAEAPIGVSGTISISVHRSSVELTTPTLISSQAISNVRCCGSSASLSSLSHNSQYSARAYPLPLDRDCDVTFIKSSPIDIFRTRGRCSAAASALTSPLHRHSHLDASSIANIQGDANPIRRIMMLIFPILNRDKHAWIHLTHLINT